MHKGALMKVCVVSCLSLSLSLLVQSCPLTLQVGVLQCAVHKRGFAPGVLTQSACDVGTPAWTAAGAAAAAARRTCKSLSLGASAAAAL